MVQIPTSDPASFDVVRAAESATYAAEIEGTVRSHGLGRDADPPGRAGLAAAGAQGPCDVLGRAGLAFIDQYHHRIRAFRVKDAESRTDGRQGVYGGYAGWVEHAFDDFADGQADTAALRSGRALGLDEARICTDYEVMARTEAARDDGIEAVAIVKPNHLHAPVARAFLKAGIHLICDKPVAPTIEAQRSAR